MSNRNKSSEFDDGSDVTGPGVFTMVDGLIGTDGIVVDGGHFAVFVNRVPGTRQLNFPVQVQDAYNNMSVRWIANLPSVMLAVPMILKNMHPSSTPLL